MASHGSLDTKSNLKKKNTKSNLRITSDFLQSLFLFSLISLISSSPSPSRENWKLQPVYSTVGSTGSPISTVPAEEAGVSWDGSWWHLTVAVVRSQYLYAEIVWSSGRSPGLEVSHDSWGSSLMQSSYVTSDKAQMFYFSGPHVYSMYIMRITRPLRIKWDQIYQMIWPN